MVSPLVTTAEIEEFRRDAESMMTLIFTPHAPSGKTTVNEQEVQGYTDETPVVGKVKGPSAQTGDPITRTVTIGSVEVPVVVGGLHIPISAQPPIAGEHGIGWEYEVTSVGATDDPALLGRRYLVTNSPAMSHATARRLDVAEVPGADS